MTEDDLDDIERALAIRLPSEYRRVMGAFPIPACRGNDDTELWDHAARLVELNRELRQGRHYAKPWPAQFFALGTDAGGSTQALNLADGTVPWADRCHLPEWRQPNRPTPFPAWCESYVAGLRDDLTGDGIDPDGSPADAKRQTELNERAGNRAYCGCIIALLVILAGVVVWRILG